MPIIATCPPAKPNAASSFRATKERGTHQSMSTDQQTFSVNDLIELARVCVDVDVFAAPRGKIMATWSDVATRLRHLGICHSDSVIRKKLESLLKWHDDPASVPESTFKILEGNAGIPVAALDKLAARKRECEDKTDTERVRLHDKAVLEKKAGETIRKASMRMCRGCPVLGDEVADDDLSSDIEIISYTPANVLDDTVNTTQNSKVKHERKNVEALKPVTIKKESSSENIDLNNLPTAEKKKRKVKHMLRTPAKKKKASSDSDTDGPSPSSSRRSQRERHSYFDLKSFMLEECEKREVFQEKLLREVTRSNEVYANSIRSTEQFQNNFLTLLKERL
ncbi:hypothetical protein C0993_007253 [Termitomyces sp. T159_Od127]|nr:hypothetical protein C0993_007253 [Termitomyces sp. T159_Od127]